MRHIISVLLENESGALARVANLFTARGFNIESLSVAPTEDETVSRMTIVSVGSDNVIEQINKQLNKLVDVVKVIDLTESVHVEREMMLIKIDAQKTELKEEIMRMAEVFRARIIDVCDAAYTLELTGDSDKLDAFVRAMAKLRIIEVVRSGPLATARGAKALHV